MVYVSCGYSLWLFPVVLLTDSDQIHSPRSGHVSKETILWKSLHSSELRAYRHLHDVAQAFHCKCIGAEAADDLVRFQGHDLVWHSPEYDICPRQSPLDSFEASLWGECYWNAPAIRRSCGPPNEPVNWSRRFSGRSSRGTTRPLMRARTRTPCWEEPRNFFSVVGNVLLGLPAGEKCRKHFQQSKAVCYTELSEIKSLSHNANRRTASNLSMSTFTIFSRFQWYTDGQAACLWHSSDISTRWAPSEQPLLHDRSL